MSKDLISELNEIESKLVIEGIDKKKGKVRCIKACDGCMGTQMLCAREVVLDF